MSLVEVEAPRESTDAGAMSPERDVATPTREVRHEYARSLPPLLNQLGVSLLVSTYQAGKVVAVGVADGDLTLSYHNFERAMGLAVRRDGIAVAARAQVWNLRGAPDLAARDHRRHRPIRGRHRGLHRGAADRSGQPPDRRLLRRVHFHPSGAPSGAVTAD